VSFFIAVRCTGAVPARKTDNSGSLDNQKMPRYTPLTLCSDAGKLISSAAIKIKDSSYISRQIDMLKFQPYKEVLAFIINPAF